MARFHEDLTPRERAVLAEAQTGATTPEIATRLFVGPETVKKHLSSIYLKANVTSRVEVLAASLDSQTLDLSRFGFSPRQQDVVRCLLLGKTNQQIGRTLFLSAETIKDHLKGIYTLLGARNRYDAVSIIIRAAELPGTSDATPSLAAQAAAVLCR